MPAQRHGKLYLEGGRMPEESDSLLLQSDLTERVLANTLAKSYLDLRSLNLSPMEAWQVVEHCVSQAHSNWKALEPTGAVSTAPTKSEERITGTVIADAVGAYQRYASGQPAIFFGVHRQHSRRVCEGLRALGCGHNTLTAMIHLQGVTVSCLLCEREAWMSWGTAT